MKIVFCGETFPKASEMLKKLLPGDNVLQTAPHRIVPEGLTADVLIPLMHRLEPELLEGTSASVIHQWGVGLEGVDVSVATRRGIPVCNVPGDLTPNADSTAEHGLFLMLASARRIHECFASFSEGKWGSPTGSMLMGKTALIVGFGRVGKALARRLIALGMRVEAIRRTPNKEIEREIGLARAGNTDQLIEFASHADFVVSAASVYPETRGLFNRDLFAAMKPDAFVVNISRGPVVNERDLVEALREKRIAGAGLDVFETEPPDPDNPLFQFPNVFRTPHVAGATSQNYDGIAQVVVHNLELVRSGKFPLHCVNATQLGSKLGKFPLS